MVQRSPVRYRTWFPAHADWHFRADCLAAPARAGLDDYVKKPDSAFAWTQTGTLNDAGRDHHHASR